MLFILSCCVQTLNKKVFVYRYLQCRPVLATAAGTFFTRCPGSHMHRGHMHLWVFGCLRQVAYHPEHDIAARQQRVLGVYDPELKFLFIQMWMNVRPCSKLGLHVAVN